jgi:hypothetical protein
VDIRAQITGGVCGLVTVVQATSPDGMHVHLTVESECPQVRAMAADLQPIDALNEILQKSMMETTPALLAARHKLHVTCLVPVGMLKAVEAAAGLALPASAGVELDRID